MMKQTLILAALLASATAFAPSSSRCVWCVCLCFVVYRNSSMSSGGCARRVFAVCTDFLCIHLLFAFDGLMEEILFLPRLCSTPPESLPATFRRMCWSHAWRGSCPHSLMLREGAVPTVATAAVFDSTFFYAHNFLLDSSS
jgi:hypothetical protein